MKKLLMCLMSFAGLAASSMTNAAQTGSVKKFYRGSNPFVDCRYSKFPRFNVCNLNPAQLINFDQQRNANNQDKAVKVVVHDQGIQTDLKLDDMQKQEKVLVNMREIFEQSEASNQQLKKHVETLRAKNVQTNAARFNLANNILCHFSTYLSENSKGIVDLADTYAVTPPTYTQINDDMFSQDCSGACAQTIQQIKKKIKNVLLKLVFYKI